MKKLLLSALVLVPAMAFAAEFTSPGNGTTYTLQSLSEIDSCSITLESPGVYVMAEDVTIAAKDAFKMDNGVTLKMGGTTTFRIEGKSDFSCADSTTVTRNVEGDLPKGFYLANEAVDTVYFKNMHFQYAGVRTWMTDSYVELDNCSFMYNNGKNSSSGALSLAKDGTCFKVTNCKFIANEVPAIGGASNMANGILVENCYFEDNNTKNANKPQLNLTVGGDNDVIIRNNILKGAKRLKVGAIAVSNLMGLPGKNNVIIEGNYMDNHRYGITTNGPLKVRIIDNQIIDNNHESNPANGGSCISLYDSKYNQEAYIKGNRLEGGLWGITVIGGKSVNVGKTANPSSPDYNPGQNVFVNNGNNGKLYDIYNNGTNAVYAQGNTWNVSVQTPDSIEKVITHIVDNPALGRVIFTEKKAAKFVSPGNGTTYTLKSLSEIDSCGIILENNGIYAMTHDITIAAKDAFKMDNGATLKMGGTTTFRIEGKSDFSCTDSTTVTRDVEGDLPKGFYLANEAVDTVYFKNMHFQYAGVRTWMTDSYVELDSCSFMYNNGKNSSSGALSLAKDGTCFKVTNSKFIANEVPAIGGASNMANGILVENCYFEDNNTKNANKPQLNLTVGGDNDVIIRNNILKGAKRLKVGAIAVSNLMGLPGENNVIIEGNYMDNHRYGITTNGPLKVRIIDNQIIDNNHESNPANGGSCISLYDSKYNQEAYIKGNRLEGGLWGITVIGGKSVNVGKTANPSSPDYNPGQNVFVNNGNGGKLYDIYNNGTNAVYAQGNTWNVSVQTPDSIEKVISHIVDNPALGRVIFTEKKAAKFVSPGNGTTYTLKSLSEIDTCGIILENNGVYAMTHDIEITPKDTFSMESGVTLKMGHGVQFYAEGAVQMNCADQSTVTRDGNDVPYGFYVATENPVDTMFINNVKFDYAGLRTHYVGKAKITDCEFNNNNGKNSSQGALALGPSDGEYIVNNCKFVGNSVPAIGVAANYLLGLDIENCYFEDNNTANTNKPFVNITIGGEHDIIIRDCEFVGAKRTMVGGIAVSNMLSAAGQNNVIIEGNKLTGLRYGVTLTSGPMNAIIKDNELVDNKYDTNPMNGGSGISLYDPYGYQNVHIEGNTITDNFWGITVIGGGNVNIGKTANPDAEDYNPGNNVFNNNSNGGQPYDLYNNGTKTIYAQGNTWGVDEQTAEKIESVIFHKADNESLGLVIFMPEENAVEEIEVDDNTPAVYYNIQGVKVNNPSNGLFIKVQGNKATKVVL